MRLTASAPRHRFARAPRRELGGGAPAARGRVRVGGSRLLGGLRVGELGVGGEGAVPLRQATSEKNRSAAGQLRATSNAALLNTAAPRALEVRGGG
ncbi:hypothetical protein GCM10010472_03490 [Pseudonocardia halophobica]|uniref:Uncharacterized protein n=1 Tax=Pseudonocardia halophobica TaxID=29401 RepID=A0A9W6L403_9PSEU|nr:hypothetical protein GCM10017577_18290 [Pseudonocardia halophobica]